MAFANGYWLDMSQIESHNHRIDSTIGANTVKGSPINLEYHMFPF